MDYYIEKAEALFSRFAERHRLGYEATKDEPIEVLWTFPPQDGLKLPITLGLQNGDELNFGVSDFWSYFFPYEKVADQFERILDAWMVGDARVAITGPWGRVLQVREGRGWKSVYAANRLFPVWRTPKRTIENRSPPEVGA
jgi:hypothetical protein